MKRTLPFVTLMVIGMAGPAIALEMADSGTQGLKSAVHDALKRQEVTLKGVVEKSNNQLWLLDGTTAYLLDQAQALEPLVGLPVEIQGIFFPQGNEMVIQVGQIKVIH